VAEQLPASIELRDLGGLRLRDLAVREHVFQLVTPDLSATFPAPRGADVALNNLPVQLTSFIGRTREKSELVHFLGGARLVTVTGPGGSGKTRLSLELAVDLLSQYPDGAWLIELASLSDPTLVPQAAALTLGLREEANRSWLMAWSSISGRRRSCSSWATGSISSTRRRASRTRRFAPVRM
jgi:hypothetical protein